MSTAKGPKDLLGKPIRKRRPKYEAALERHELQSVPERAERIRWLDEVMPQGAGYLMPMQSYKVFQEAKDCFVYGQYVATIVLSAAFVEHWLAGLLQASADSRAVSKAGLEAIVKYCRANELLPAVICDKVDHVRKVRNPFVHLKSGDHEHALGPRMMRQGLDPDAILEADAKGALIAMYSVARYARQA